MRCPGESSAGGCVKRRDTSITAALSGPYDSTLKIAMMYAICGRAWALSPLVDQEFGGLLTWIPAAMMSGFGVLVVLHHILHASRPADSRDRLAPSTAAK